VQYVSRPPVGLAAARERYRSGLPTKGTLVGIVGASVPVELVMAAGMMPVRLGGRPRATPLADAYGLDRLDSPTTVAFEQLLDPARPFEFAIIGGDGESHSLLFQVLREIRREERSRRLPRFSFVDVLHLRHRTTSRYDRGQLRRLLATLENWCGRRITTDDVKQAVATVNGTRRLLAEAMAFRHARPARLSGTDALHLIGAALMSSPAEVRSWVSALEAEAPGLPELSGTRVYLTGSAHEDSAAYEALESRGWVIVGEDHQWGEDALGPEIELTADPLDGLVEHYQYANLPSRRSSADRARHVADAMRADDADLVAHFAFAHDEATPWDRPAISEALAVAGLPEIMLPEQRFGQVDRDELGRAIDSLGLTGARGKR
jgi:benzoyl-CoA reductase/2-hydroxyglutaryl-CoA dehydratase subunit BcrC/BadD/HgdB